MSEQQSVRDEIIATIYATPTPAGIQSEWPFPVTVTELADGFLASPVIRGALAATSTIDRIDAALRGDGRSAMLIVTAQEIINQYREGQERHE